MKNNKKFNLHALFSDNRFLLVISLIIAIVFWAAVCISFSPETEVVVENVPIKIDTENSVPEQYGLRMFGDNSYTVDITVSGSRYVVGGKLLSADDFKVTASTALVTSAGTHSLQVKVTKANESADFTIESISENFINVYFDEYAEKQANLLVNADTDNVAPDGYMIDTDLIMDTKTVLVGGPALEISQLDSVVANLNIDRELKESTAFNVPMVAINKSGAALKFVTIDGEENATVTVTVPVYKIEELPVTLDFTNSPSKFVTDKPQYTCSPSSVKVAVLQNGTGMESLKIGTVDFSNLRPGNNTFNFSLNDVDGIKPLASTPSGVAVSVTVPSAESTTLSVPTDNISISNAPEGYSIVFSSDKIENVTVYGSMSELTSLSSGSLKIRLDLGSVTVKPGRNTFSVPLYLKDTESSWIYGKYTISFTAKVS